MSRTEGIHLPRLPTSHTRVTSSRDIRPHAAARSLRADTRRRSLTEPSYTAYVGTPRQDIPGPVFNDAAMYDDVFDKEGRLLSGRNTAKFSSPLQTVGYNSLNDPHCRKLFLNNRRLRSHLVNLGLITDDLKVVSTTKEQRQKIRAHELLERKEMLAEKLECREQERLQRLVRPFHVPQQYQDSQTRQEHRREQWARVQEMKTKKIIQHQEQERAERNKRLKQKREELAMAMEQARLQEQARRNASRVQQEFAEVRAYEKAYGKNAQWHREADRINNRMIAMQLQWSKKQQQNMLSESFLPPSQSRRNSQVHYNKSGAPSTHHQVKVQEEPLGRVEREEEVTEGERREAEGEGKVEGEGEREGEAAGDITEEKQKAEEQGLKTEEDSQHVPGMEEDVAREGDGHHEQDYQELPQDAAAPKVSPSPPSHAPLHTSQESPSPPPAQPSPPITLEGDEAKQELARIFTEAFYRFNEEGKTGYLQVGDFLEVLKSRDHGLQLEDYEQTFIASQVDVADSGVVVYADVAPLLPDLLFQIFSQRVEQSMQYYGYYVEEEWVQMYPVSGGVVYLNKLTGILQTARPVDFRPYLKDEVLEDAVVDFFEDADTDRDGVIDYEDFYNLLASPLVASRVYRSQMEQLLELYQTQTADTQWRMDLASFPTVANPLLLMIYQNAYPDVEEWIELESKKFGSFLLNKNTGETIIQQQTPEESTVAVHEPATPSTREGGRDDVDSGESSRKKSKKKKKHRKKDISEPEPSPVPPKLVPRPKSRPSQQQTTPDLLPLDHDLSSPLTSHDDDIEQHEVIVKPVSSRSRLIGPTTFETILEEDETALEDSLVVGRPAEGEESKEREEENNVVTKEVTGTEEIASELDPGEMEDQALAEAKDNGDKG